MKPEQPAINACGIEFLLTLIRSGMSHAAAVSGVLPTWGGIHALVPKANPGDESFVFTCFLSLSQNMQLSTKLLQIIKVYEDS